MSSREVNAASGDQSSSKLRRAVTGIETGRPALIRTVTDLTAGSSLLKKTKHRIRDMTFEKQQLPPFEEQGESVGQKLVKTHPLFQDTSSDFKFALSQYAKRLELTELNAKVSTQCKHLYESISKERQLRELFSEGCEVPDFLNGVLLTHPEDADVFEQAFHQFPLADASGSEYITGACGQEVALKLSSVSPFTVRRRREPTRGFFFIHADELNFVMLRFKQDAETIKQRVYQAATKFMKRSIIEHIERVPMKLFATMSHDFRRTFVKTAVVHLHPAGTHISLEKSIGSSCLHIHSGEAEVTVRGNSVCKLSQEAGSRAWESWWGALEVGGTVMQRVATVTAKTDCVVWEVSHKDCEALRLVYPAEIRFLDKVAVKHLSILSPFSARLEKISLFEPFPPDLLRQICKRFEQLIVCRDEVVYREGDDGDEMFVLMLGKCRVLHGYNSVATSRLFPGSSFGSLALLNVNGTRTCTVQADCVSELRSLNRNSLLEVLEEFPDQAAGINELVEIHSQNAKAAMRALETASKAEGGFSTGFIKLLTESMYEQPYLTNQVIIEQGVEGAELVVLVHGVVDIEVNGMHVATASAPAIFGEASLLTKGSKSGATVRAGMAAECMVLPIASSATENLRAHHEDMSKLESMLKKKMQKNQNLFAGLHEKKTEEHHDTGLFRNSNPEFVKSVTQYFEKKIYLPGQALFEEGAETRHGLAIHQGYAEVETGGKKVGRVGPGDFIGEAVILGIKDRAGATVTAETKLIAFAIAKDALQSLLEIFPAEKSNLLMLTESRKTDSEYLPNLRQLNVNSRAVLAFKRVKSKAEAVRVQAQLEEEARQEVEAEKLEAKAARKRFPSIGYHEGQRWADQKKQALQAASQIKMERLRAKGRIPVPLPPTHPLRVTKAGAGTPWAPPLPSEAFAAVNVVTSQMRLRKTTAVYGRSVWKESFQPPRTLSPIMHHGSIGDQISQGVLELEEAINEAETSLQLANAIEKETYQDDVEHSHNGLDEVNEWDDKHDVSEDEQPRVSDDESCGDSQVHSGSKEAAEEMRETHQMDTLDEVRDAHNGSDEVNGCDDKHEVSQDEQPCVSDGESCRDSQVGSGSKEAAEEMHEIHQVDTQDAVWDAHSELDEVHGCDDKHEVSQDEQPRVSDDESCRDSQVYSGSKEAADEMRDTHQMDTLDEVRETHDKDPSSLSGTPDLTLRQLMPEELEEAALEEHVQDLVGRSCEEAITDYREILINFSEPDVAVDLVKY
eukprot:TRINITY_DN14769_c0_g2_i1.p1 TRINITY_DN14769_c0_g2~~TRINITY_DN14769_c0_g2_i1.p1  ORF type:complete len:1245 (+),score=243.05 TRINITY_DN14769_c0_g2_i1:78-3812(+)